MTLWVDRSGDKITIHGNLYLDLELRDSRIIEYRINEDAGHVRGFWLSLGNALDQIEAEQRAAAEASAPPQTP